MTEAIRAVLPLGGLAPTLKLQLMSVYPPLGLGSTQTAVILKSGMCREKFPVSAPRTVTCYRSLTAVSG